VDRIAAITLACVLTAACGQQADPPNGAALAATHCGRCHPAPDPGQLSATAWPAMVDYMGAYLGHPPQEPGVQAAIAGELVPDAPLCSPAELAAIADHFRTAALSRAELRASLPPSPPATGRYVPLPLDPGTTPDATVTLAAIRAGHLALGSADPNTLQLRAGSDRLLLHTPMPSAPVAIEARGGGWRVSLMGHFAGEAGAGQIVDLALGDGAMTATPLVADYHRLVQHRSGDLDGDGTQDLLLVAFGDTPLGRCAILWSDGPEQVLIDGAGCVGAVARDLDGDGRLDLVVARAQQHCRLVAFLQRDDRRFERRVLLQRPVGWGYNQLLMADLDGDGREELITVAGNNLEQPNPPLKVHHGIRVLSVDADLGVEERRFFPLPGATQATVVDLDDDGDLDLAATACYPDWAGDPPLTALLLEQRDGDFVRHGLPDGLWQRWLTIGSGDLDGDGVPELVLGAAAYEAAMPRGARERWGPIMAQRPRVLVLRAVAGW